MIVMLLFLGKLLLAATTSKHCPLLQQLTGICHLRMKGEVIDHDEVKNAKPKKGYDV
jgi:hypothetical protein